MRLRRMLLLGALWLAPMETASAQVADLAGTWGRKRAIEAGGGDRISIFGQPILLTGGAAAIERGLAAPYVWVEEKTRVVEPTSPEGPYYNPENVRTTPEIHWWVRAEWSPSRVGLSAMLDPREYTGAAGIFATYDLTGGAAMVGEIRWAYHFGYDVSVRLRFQ